MTTLHVIAHSPFGDNRLASCLRLLGADDALLLCGDAVYALHAGSEPQRLLQAAALEQRFGKDRHLKTCGCRPFPGGISSTTWRWFLEHQPQRLRLPS